MRGQSDASLNERLNRRTGSELFHRVSDDFLRGKEFFHRTILNTYFLGSILFLRLRDQRLLLHYFKTYNHRNNLLSFLN